MVLDHRNIRAEQLFVWHPALAAEISAGNTLPRHRWLRFEDAPYLPGELDKLISEARRDRAEYGFAQLRLVLVFPALAQSEGSAGGAHPFAAAAAAGGAREEEGRARSIPARAARQRGGGEPGAAPSSEAALRPGAAGDRGPARDDAGRLSRNDLAHESGDASRACTLDKIEQARDPAHPRAGAAAAWISSAAAWRNADAGASADEGRFDYSYDRERFPAARPAAVPAAGEARRRCRMRDLAGAPPQPRLPHMVAAEPRSAA